MAEKGGSRGVGLSAFLRFAVGCLRGGGRHLRWLPFLLLTCSGWAQLVTAVNGNRLYLNVGVEEGVRPGMTGLVEKRVQLGERLLEMRVAAFEVLRAEAHTSECIVTEQNAVEGGFQGCRVIFDGDGSPGKPLGPEADPGSAHHSPTWDRTWQVPGLNITMRPVPRGAADLGSPRDEPGHGTNEARRKVVISRAFWIAETEISQGDWMRIMKVNPSHFARDTLPVEQVSWEDARRFCVLLTEHVNGGGGVPEGYVFRLPTEAEWEYACRAGTSTPFSFGDCLQKEDANYDGTHPLDGCGSTSSRFCTIDVGMTRANPWGLRDMHGNVWEWCEDSYQKSVTAAGTRDPLCRNGAERVLRGGGWNSSAEACRSANRGFRPPNGSYANVGFRIVLAPER